MQLAFRDKTSRFARKLKKPKCASERFGCATCTPAARPMPMRSHQTIPAQTDPTNRFCFLTERQRRLGRAAPADLDEG